MAQNLCSRFFKLPFTTHVMPEKHANFGLARAYGAFWPLKGLALGLWDKGNVLAEKSPFDLSRQFGVIHKPRGQNFGYF